MAILVIFLLSSIFTISFITFHFLFLYFLSPKLSRTSKIVISFILGNLVIWYLAKDTQDYNLTSDQDYFDNDFGEMIYVEDQNWMDKYIDPMLAPLFEAQGFVNPFKGKIVVLGTSLAEDQDIKPTPFLSYGEQDHLMPGLEIHANAIQQLLNADYIQMPTGTLEYKALFNKNHLL